MDPTPAELKPDPSKNFLIKVDRLTELGDLSELDLCQLAMEFLETKANGEVRGAFLEFLEAKAKANADAA